MWEAWDYTAFVEVSPGISQARGTARDRSLLGGLAAARERYAQRYLPGQALYLRECRPKEHANVVIGNEDPANPALWMR